MNTNGLKNLQINFAEGSKWPYVLVYGESLVLAYSNSEKCIKAIKAAFEKELAIVLKKQVLDAETFQYDALENGIAIHGMPWMAFNKPAPWKKVLAAHTKGCRSIIESTVSAS